MFRLEHGAVDVTKAKKQLPQLVQLIELKKSFEDDYSLNSALRGKFRV